jgi:hypothetical protein
MQSNVSLAGILLPANDLDFTGQAIDGRIRRVLLVVKCFTMGTH